MQAGTVERAVGPTVDSKRRKGKGAHKGDLMMYVLLVPCQQCAGELFVSITSATATKRHAERTDGAMMDVDDIPSDSAPNCAPNLAL
ncbi:hypothetical protein quinque_004535 [Culex quinquefasciatus]